MSCIIVSLNEKHVMVSIGKPEENKIIFVNALNGYNHVLTQLTFISLIMACSPRSPRIK